MKTTHYFAAALLLIGMLAFPGCGLPERPSASAQTAKDRPTAPSGNVAPIVEAKKVTVTDKQAPAPEAATHRLQPGDLRYLGAFRLPEGSNDTSWEYSGHALAYYPGGDPKGPDDGFPGSLYGTGHNWQQQISEINVPAPVVPADKNVEELNTAVTLQPFHDIRKSLNMGELELPCAGLEYLPPQGEQTTGKLHFCWGQHYQFERVPSHGWCELNLGDPKTAGPWYLGQQSNFATDNYLFEIPQDWAERHTPGKRLATGRFRDGGWSGMGPALFAYGPWNEGNPPPPGATLEETPLLLYTSSEAMEPEPHTMTGYQNSDEWSGGAWLTAGDKSAVVFVGTKGIGKCWYGFSNGVVWPDEAPFPPIPDPPHDRRGWWSTEFRGQFIFYDPADLAAVAEGRMESYQPQPYAALDVDEHLFGVKSRQQWYHLGAAAFDRARGHLYVLEPLADGDKSLVHVWKVGD